MSITYRRRRSIGVLIVAKGRRVRIPSPDLAVSKKMGCK